MIINLFPSRYVFLIKSIKTRKKINRTSSDLMDKTDNIWNIWNIKLHYLSILEFEN